jgi:hypothetical protein
MAQMKNRSAKAQNGLSNHEVVTLAVYLLGGDTKPVDSEDIAVKANEIAPARFTWRKYRNQINLGNVRWSLWDAKKPKNGAFLLEVGKDDWQLTEAGLEFAKGAALSLKGMDLSRQPVSARDRQWQRNERARMLSTEAFAKIQNGTAHTVTTREAEEFFRIDAYVSSNSREQKITRAISGFGNDEELGSAVKLLAEKVRTGGNQ